MQSAKFFAAITIGLSGTVFAGDNYFCYPGGKIKNTEYYFEGHVKDDATAAKCSLGIAKNSQAPVWVDLESCEVSSSDKKTKFQFKYRNLIRVLEVEPNLVDGGEFLEATLRLARLKIAELKCEISDDSMSDL